MSLFYTFIDFYYFFLNIDVVIKYSLQYLVPVILAFSSNLAYTQSHFNNINNSSKLSTVSRLAFSQNQQIKRLFVKDENQKFYALIQFNKNLTESELNDLSSLIIQKYGFIAQMRLTESEIKMLINDERVDHIELSHKMNAPRLLNDKARLHSKVFQAQVYQGMQPSQLIRGKGVLVGIVDIGFQTDHPTFFNDNGTDYRVKRFWNQTSISGVPPKLFPYGSLFSTENSILQAIDDDGTHGTHVAGISAGSGFQSPSNIFAGVAPDAALAFVSIKYANDTIKGSAKGDLLIANPTILDGFDYLIKYADSIKYPITCNLSWGMHTGPHDGTSLFDLALENIVKQGSIWGGKPFGRSIIGANGNDGRNNMHIELSLNNDTLHTLAMDRSRKSYPTEDVYCDFWCESGSDVQIKVSLIDSFNQEILSSQYFSMNQNNLVFNKLINGSDSIIYTLSFQKAYVNNGKSNCLLSVQSSGSKRFIKLSFKGKGIVNGWNSGRTYEWTSGTFRSYINTLYPLNFVEGDATSTLGENGGTGKWITSVGAYTNRNEWVNFEGKTQGDKSLNVGQLAGFSSRGPSIDGRIKPDVAAPGQLIASAVHTRQVPGWIGNEILYKTQFNGKDVVWALFSGTSMAAPHVNGVAALVLQVAPNLNSYEMATVLRLSAQRDSFTTNDSNNNYGYGKVNALNAVKMALTISSVSSLNKNDKPILLLKDNQLTIKNLKSINSTIELTVFDVTGKEIFKGNSNNSEFSTKINISDGIYFFQLKSNHILSKGKVLLLN
jgi:subtilisin family serine protease